MTISHSNLVSSSAYPAKNCGLQHSELPGIKSHSKAEGAMHKQYGSTNEMYKPGPCRPSKTSSFTRVGSDTALKFFGVVAVAGLLLRERVFFYGVEFLVKGGIGNVEKGSEGFLPVSTLTGQPTNATTVTAAVLHLLAQMDWHHVYPHSHGHCVDRDESLCATWMPANGSVAATLACAHDSQLTDAMCPRTCGLCAVPLSGCQRLRVVDVDIQCNVGEDPVGKVCTNHHKTGDESYCTYLPPGAGPGAGSGVDPGAGPGTDPALSVLRKPKFVCAHCDDPVVERGKDALHGDEMVMEGLDSLLKKAKEATNE